MEEVLKQIEDALKLIKCDEKSEVIKMDIFVEIKSHQRILGIHISLPSNVKLCEACVRKV